MRRFLERMLEPARRAAAWTTTSPVRSTRTWRCSRTPTKPAACRRTPPGVPRGWPSAASSTSRSSIGMRGRSAGSKTPGGMPRTGFGCCGAAPCSPRRRPCRWRSASAPTPRSSRWPMRLLFRPPAGIADPSELVVIGTARGDGGLNPLSYAAYLEIARRTTSLTSVFAEELFPHVMGLVPAGTATAEPVLGRYVTPNFFSDARRAPVSWPRVRRGRRGRGGPRLRLLEAAIQRRRRDGRPGAADQRAAGDHRRRRGAGLPGHRNPEVRRVARHRIRRRVDQDGHGRRSAAAGRAVRHRGRGSEGHR